jgi:hypothetical protein
MFAFASSLRPYDGLSLCMPLQHPDQQPRHIRPPNTHINKQTSIISNGTTSKSQPGRNQYHIRTSVSPVQDETLAEKDTSGTYVSLSLSGSSCSMKGDTMEYETVQIEKTKNVCSLCEDYAKRQASKPVVVMSC